MQAGILVATCVAASAAAIPQRKGSFFLSDSVNLHLTPGKRYPVLGLELFGNMLTILTIDDTPGMWPCMMPVEPYDIAISALPASWLFRVLPLNSDDFAGGSRARWGYREFVESADFRDRLVNSEEAEHRWFISKLEAYESVAGE